MPSYEYRCTQCLQEFQAKASWREKGEIRCPHCGGSELQELFGRYTINVQSAASRKELPPTCRGCEAAGSTCPMNH